MYFEYGSIDAWDDFTIDADVETVWCWLERTEETPLSTLANHHIMREDDSFFFPPLEWTPRVGLTHTSAPSGTAASDQHNGRESEVNSTIATVLCQNSIQPTLLLRTQGILI